MEASSGKRLNSPQLPEDLIMQIMLRVPVKSLVRFRLVSKIWCNILKTPYFVSMHHKFNMSQSQLLVCTTYRSRKKDPYYSYNHVFSFYSNDKSVRKLSQELRILADPNNTFAHLLPGACNGIVCYYNDLSSIFLSNPATREFKRLPPTTFQQVKDQEWYQSAVASGCDSDNMYDQMWYQSGVAFGFDSPNIYDFKVLRLFCRLTEKGMYEPSNKGLRVEMFTLSSNTWKQLHWGLDDSLVFHRPGGFFCANSIHFFADSAKGQAFPATIVWCDILTERFNTMEFPSVGSRQGSFNQLMVFKEFLSSAFNLVPYNQGLLEIWIMKDYGVVESWTKLYKIGPPWGFSIPQCFWIEDDALLLLHWETYKLGSCHLNTLHVEDVKIDGSKGAPQLVVYKETLVTILFQSWDNSHPSLR